MILTINNFQNNDDIQTLINLLKTDVLNIDQHQYIKLYIVSFEDLSKKYRLVNQR